MPGCLILTPVHSHIEPPCEEGLRELERRGYTVRRVRGYAAIDQARNQMATDAVSEGWEETLWIDADICFQPDDVEKLRGHNLPIVCGIYPQKGKRALAGHLLPGTERVTFGAKGGLLEILYAATGFLHVRRAVYKTIQHELKLPVCNTRFGKPLVPFFWPMVLEERGQGSGDGERGEERKNGGGTPGADASGSQGREEGTGREIRPTLALSTDHQPLTTSWYLAEDFAFCERARQCGFKILADTSIRLFHYGSYGYTWEDAGADAKRWGTYHFQVQPPETGE